MEAIRFIKTYRKPYIGDIDYTFKDEKGHTYAYYLMLYNLIRHRICRNCAEECKFKTKDIILYPGTPFQCSICNECYDGDRFYVITSFKDVEHMMYKCFIKHKYDDVMSPIEDILSIFVDFFDENEEYRQMMINHTRLLKMFNKIDDIDEIIFDYVCRNLTVNQFICYFNNECEAFLGDRYEYNPKLYLKNGEEKKVEEIDNLINYCHDDYQIIFYMYLMHGLVSNQYIIERVKLRAKFLMEIDSDKYKDLDKKFNNRIEEFKEEYKDSFNN